MSRQFFFKSFIFYLIQTNSKRVIRVIVVGLDKSQALTDCPTSTKTRVSRLIVFFRVVDSRPARPRRTFGCLAPRCSNVTRNVAFVFARNKRASPSSFGTTFFLPGDTCAAVASTPKTDFDFVTRASRSESFSRSPADGIHLICRFPKSTPSYDRNQIRASNRKT